MRKSLLFFFVVIGCVGLSHAWMASSVNGYVSSNNLTVIGDVSAQCNLQLTSVCGVQAQLSLLANALAQLQASFTNQAAPVGSISAYAGTSSPSPAWLLCDGSAVRSADYPLLYSVIGTSYGNGNLNANSTVNTDSTRNFNLPDLRGVFLRGVTGGTTNDPDVISRTALRPGGNVGNQVGSFQGDSYQAHAHGIEDPGHWHSLPEVQAGSDLYQYFNWLQSSTASITFTTAPSVPTTSPSMTGITTTTSAGTSSETRPKNVNVNYIIRAA